MSARIPKWLRRRVRRFRVTARGALALKNLKDQTGLEEDEIIDAAIRAVSPEALQCIVSDDIDEVVDWQRL